MRLATSLQSIVSDVEHTIRTAPCSKYSYTDRLGILQYRRGSANTGNDCTNTFGFPSKNEKEEETLSHCISFALRSHTKAAKSDPTPLQTPVLVFCPDNLKRTWFGDSPDTRVSLRHKLGRFVTTYEDLVRWYISFSLD